MAVSGQLQGARLEVHIHFHGVTAEDVAQILADVNGTTAEASCKHPKGHRWGTRPGQAPITCPRLRVPACGSCGGWYPHRPAPLLPGRRSPAFGTKVRGMARLERAVGLAEHAGHRRVTG